MTALLGVDLGVHKIAISVFAEGDSGLTLYEVLAHTSTGATRADQLAEVAAVAHDTALFYDADWCFIEEPIMGNNHKYSLQLSATCGAVMARLAGLRHQQSLAIEMASNKAWKKAIIGNGNSSKDVIRTWVHEHHPAYAALCGVDQDQYDAVCIGLYGLDLVDRAAHLTL